MARFIILSKIGPGAFRDPKDFPKVAEEVKTHIKEQCPGVDWKDSYATCGQYDVVDLVEADSIEEVEKAAMIIRSYGHATTQTMPATPWKDFLDSLS